MVGYALWWAVESVGVRSGFCGGVREEEGWRAWVV